MFVCLDAERVDDGCYVIASFSGQFEDSFNLVFNSYFLLRGKSLIQIITVIVNRDLFQTALMLCFISSKNMEACTEHDLKAL